MFRTIRILLATPVYLLAYLVLIISLRIYPQDIREDARDSFLSTRVQRNRTGAGLV